MIVNATPKSHSAACDRLPDDTLNAGEYEGGLSPQNAAEYAGLFEYAELAVQPGAGHYPWLDDPARFTRSLAVFPG